MQSTHVREGKRKPEILKSIQICEIPKHKNHSVGKA